MKKISLIVMFLVMSFALITCVGAYSTSKYSIDIPSTYIKTAEGAFSKLNGDNISISVTTIDGKMEYPYTEKNLNELAEELKKQINNNKDLVMSSVENKMYEYNTNVAEDDLKTIVDSMNINDIEIKEITTMSKNNYKCFRIRANCQVIGYTAYIDQYYVFSRNDLYIITNTMGSKEDLESQEIKDILNSFTISNYKEPVKDSVFSKAIVRDFIVGGVVGALGGLIMHISSKKKRKNKEIVLNKDRHIDENDDVIKNTKNENNDNNPIKNLDDNQDNKN